MAWTETKKNLLLLGTLGSNLVAGVIFKYQQMQTVDGQSFSHPFCQTLMMFIGELLCYGVFLIYKRLYAKEYEKDRQECVAQGQSDKVNFFIFSLPALCDMISSTIAFFTISMMPLSMLQMFNGGNIIVTAIFSVVFLKAKFYRQNVLGIFLTVFGLAFMGLMALIVDSGSIDDPDKMIIGMILVFCSFFTNATQMVLEERFFVQYFLHPFQAVGYEGMFGIFYASIGILVFNFIPSPSNFDPSSNGKIEDFPNFIYQVFSFQNVALFFLVIICILMIIVLNGANQAITKHVSALARVVLGVTYALVMWMFTLAVGWENFKWYQLVAYSIIATGTLIYNEILVLPFFGFNKNLRRNATAAAVTQEDQQFLHGSLAKQSLRGSRRTYSSFKSIQQFNIQCDEPISEISEQNSEN